MKSSDKQNIYTEILNKVKSSQNGQASETMNRLGLKYDLNYGVSIVKLKEIASDYFPNTELAYILLKKNIRETKILAYMLFDFEKMTAKEISDLMQSIDNHELAEQFSVNLSNRVDSNNVDFELLFNTGNIYHLTAVYILCSRYAQFNKKTNDDLFMGCLQNINKHLIYDNIHLTKAISRVLRTIALRNNFLKNKVITFITELKKKNTTQTDMIFEEVMPLINS